MLPKQTTYMKMLLAAVTLALVIGTGAAFAASEDQRR